MDGEYTLAGVQTWTSVMTIVHCELYYEIMLNIKDNTNNMLSQYIPNAPISEAENRPQRILPL